MMKRLLLIILAFIFFASPAYADWLSGWDQRIKLTIDQTKVDATLTWFPVTVILTSSHGDCVFDELTSDENRTKIAFAKADGTTELYGEIEKWDDANESAVIHVSRDGWEIASDADTDFYMYYDVDHAANTTYIGDIDSTPGASVWDSNFKAVYHMADATTSTVKDSTSTGADGTKKGANEPNETVGKVANAQDFDGSDDYIEIDGATIDFTSTGYAYTVESVFYADNNSHTGNLVSMGTGGDWQIIFRLDNSGKITTYHANNVGGFSYAQTAFSATTDYYGSSSWDQTTLSLYLNGTSQDTAADNTCDMTSIGNSDIGRQMQAASEYLNGKQSEVRISTSCRSAAWLKATYNTLWDSLLTYGSEEEVPASTFVPMVIIF